MRLLLISSSFPADEDDSQNAGVFVRQLACMLTDSGHEVVVLTPQQVDDPSAPFKVRSFAWLGDDASLSHVDTRRLRNLFRLATLMLSGIWNGIRVVREERPDRVIAFWAVPSGIIAYAARLFTRCPYDVWALGSDIWRIDDYPQGRRILRRVLRSAERRFADGPDLANEAAEISSLGCEFLPSSRVLPPPTDPDASWPHDRVEIFCVARFHPHKGVDVLIEAVGRLSPAERDQLRLTIRGGGPDEHFIRDLTARLRLEGCVTIGGIIDAQDLRDRLQQSDLAVIPSRLESIPLVLSDFAQSDIPMIVTDTGDLGRLTAQHNAGWVIEADNADEMAKAIGEFLRCGEAGSSAGRASLTRSLHLHSSMERLVRSEQD